MKNEINIPQDENNYGEQKVVALMKQIRYLKGKYCQSNYKSIDFSEIVLTYVDLAPIITTLDEKKENESAKYRLPLSEVGPRQKYRRIDDISTTITKEAEKQQVTKNILMGMVV